MKKFLCAAAAFGLGLVCLAPPAAALSEETEILLELLESKGVIAKGEAASFRQIIEQRMAARQAASGPEPGHHHAVRSVEDRLERLEQALTEATGAKGISLSGVIEIEAGVTSQKNAAGATTSTSDVSLATAELDVDAAVNDNIDAHVALLYEEGDTDPPNIDEAYVTVHGTGDNPFSVRAGRMYVPFGSFESHFITDPLTLTLGETNDTAVVAGYDNGLVAVSLGAFQGAVKKTGKTDKINTLVAAASYTLPADAVPGLAGSLSLSYLSNLAASDTLQGETTVAGEVRDPAAGLGTALHLEMAERFFFDAEFVGALDDFDPADLSFTDAANRRPRTWNFEVAAQVMDRLEAALRYGGSDETGIFLPEEQYGVALLYQLFDNTSLTAEYLWEDFADNSKNRQGTVQLAVEF